MNPEVIGYAAGAFAAAALIPQVVKSWRTKSTHDISILWTSIYLIALVLWVLYGWMIMSYPLVVMASFETVLAISLLILKLRYG